MLERDNLLIEAWPLRASSAGELARPIRSMPESASLGFAVLLPATRWSWLAGPALQVREAEDASLLMTVRRKWRWSRCWMVCDADDRFVGKVYPRALLNARGQVVASLEVAGPPACGRFLGPDGRELAGFHARPDGNLALLFGPNPENNPFTRMILLAAVLVLP